MGRLEIRAQSFALRRPAPPPAGWPVAQIDPELKGGGSSSLQGVAFWTVTTKKRDRFCASRVTYDTTGEKPAVVSVD